jgi:transcriptional regulator with XRE-family HTH domain
MKKTVGRNIQNLRQALNLTQQQLAEAAGTDQPHLSRIELDKYAPSLPTLSAIAKALRVPVAELMRGM